MNASSVEPLRFSSFLDPGPEYSLAPFWFWNDTLSEDEIDRQMDDFQAKGVDAFTIHARQGLDPAIGYLTEEWFRYVVFAVRRARERGMKVILYDEATYPSGSCRGEVVRENPGYAARALYLRDVPPSDPREELVGSFVQEGATRYIVEADTFGTIRGPFDGEDDGQPLAPRAADLLNPEAVACFLRLTHQRYYDHLAEEFGRTIVAFFTDEPSLAGRCPRSGGVSWTRGFLADFLAAGCTRNDLRFLFVDKDSPDGRRVDAIYRKTVTERLNRVYYGQLADWCHAHGIALTGHPAESMDIALLDAFDIPGQDIVWRYVAPGENSALEGPHSTMGKCASDAARHAGRRRNLNECFGVCGHKDDPYAFARDDMKWYMDWLFVRGCNLLVPHAFYYSIRGNRRDERPPDVGPHASFWAEYREMADYCKRCCAVNTDSMNVTDVAILCTEDDLPWRPAKPLYQTQVEFNYLERRLLSGCEWRDGVCSLRNQAYRVLIVDRVFDPETERFLSAFQDAGGVVLRHSPDTDDRAFTAAVRAASRTCIDMDPHPDLRLTHVRKGGRDILFFTNEGEGMVKTVVRAPVAEVWDAETGTDTPWQGETYPLRLARRKSMHLVLG